MSLSLYAATVPGYLQGLGAVAGLLDKAEAHCAAGNIAAEKLLQARLAADMQPFAYQVKSAVVHSLGAIDGVRRAVFAPDTTTPPDSFPALKATVGEAIASLQAIEAAEIEGFIGRDMRFDIGERHLDFLAEDFLLSFSLPNFYFHATTAYDILRWQGMSIGKRDFLGRMRIKR